ncbi:MAG: VOC family protein [Deltaproteobacteria bacterium]|nr:MAG: VOC family protein [Deltaproteobacteria bacterium]
MPVTCTHLAIHARDVERAADFYRRYAGLKEIHRRRDGSTTVVWLAEPERGSQGTVVVLLSAEHADAVAPAPLAHIGYAVDRREDVDRIAAMAEREGILVEPARDAGPIVGYFCIVCDPDGNAVEFSHGQSLGPST